MDGTPLAWAKSLWRDRTGSWAWPTLYYDALIGKSENGDKSQNPPTGRRAYQGLPGLHNLYFVGAESLATFNPPSAPEWTVGCTRPRRESGLKRRPGAWTNPIDVLA